MYLNNTLKKKNVVHVNIPANRIFFFHILHTDFDQTSITLIDFIVRIVN